MFYELPKKWYTCRMRVPGYGVRQPPGSAVILETL